MTKLKVTWRVNGAAAEVKTTEVPFSSSITEVGTTGVIAFRTSNGTGGAVVHLAIPADRLISAEPVEVSE